MGLFDFLFRTKPDEPPPIPVPKERLWVGKIVGLILAQITDSGIRGIETWTVVIDEQFLTPGLFSGAAPPSETGRKCTLGECKSLQAVIEASEIGLPFLEPMVQDLAFEVCRHAEPNWDELIDRYYARAYGYEYAPKPPKDLDAARDA